MRTYQILTTRVYQALIPIISQSKLSNIDESVISMISFTVIIPTHTGAFKAKIDTRIQWKNQVPIRYNDAWTRKSTQFPQRGGLG